MHSKHTPGPWGCVDTSNHAHDYRLTRPDGRPLPVSASRYDRSEQRANARLIAAAPEMLDALIVARRYVESCAEPGTPGGDALAQVDAAIAKAEGRAHSSPTDNPQG